MTATRINFVGKINDTDIQRKFSDKWKIQQRWNPMGIIETFMDRSTGLSNDIEAFK